MMLRSGPAMGASEGFSATVLYVCTVQDETPEFEIHCQWDETRWWCGCEWKIWEEAIPNSRSNNYPWWPPDFATLILIYLCVHCTSLWIIFLHCLEEVTSAFWNVQSYRYYLAVSPIEREVMWIFRNLHQMWRAPTQWRPSPCSSYLDLTYFVYMLYNSSRENLTKRIEPGQFET